METLGGKSGVAQYVCDMEACGRATYNRLVFSSSHVTCRHTGWQSCRAKVGGSTTEQQLLGNVFRVYSRELCDQCKDLGVSKDRLVPLRARLIHNASWDALNCNTFLFEPDCLFVRARVFVLSRRVPGAWSVFFC
jgi:hypothetical protein